MSNPTTPVEPAGCPSIPGPNPEHVGAVKRRADLILESGKLPEWIFICGISGGTLTFRPGSGDRPVILLFTTPHAALDYSRATKTSAEVRQLKFDDLPKVAQGWIDAGADQFVLNKCPRCNVMMAGPAPYLIDKPGFLKIWAVVRATQLFQGEVKVREFMLHLKDMSSRPRARATLELIRDHIDCSTPYLHELIAFLARQDHDEAAMAAAVERLNEFGPQFAGWQARWDFSAAAKAPGSNALAVAIVGLAQNFGMDVLKA